MPVATSLASLLEKLKVEEPYLPPRNWETLPSQSGRFLPTTRSSASPSSSSSVSESSLVRLTLNALQGVESSLISIEKLSSAFCSEPADRTLQKIPFLLLNISLKLSNFFAELEIIYCLCSYCSSLLMC